jgi:hypothetical protein
VPLHAIRQPWNACQCSQKFLLLSLFFSSTSLLLSLVFSTRILQLLSCSLNKTAVASSSSWHLTKKSLGLSPRFLQLPLLNKNLLASHQEWVRPFALINFMREGEEFSNLTAEIRLDGWLRFGVSSLTLTLIIKLSFNLHLTN